MKTESYSHCHGESSFHIVFSPKYRHDVFGKDEIKTFCEKCFDEVASKENFDRRALKVMEDGCFWETHLKGKINKLL